MKTVSKSIITTILCFLLSFNGCDLIDESFNYIVVTVQLTVNVLDGEPGMAVKMAAQKAGGELIQETGTLGNSQTTSLTAVFNLYREQPIEVRADLVGYPTIWAYKNLFWETVEKAKLNEKAFEKRKGVPDEVEYVFAYFDTKTAIELVVWKEDSLKISEIKDIIIIIEKIIKKYLKVEPVIK